MATSTPKAPELVVEAKDTSMKPKSNHKVLEVRTHVGVQIGPDVLTSISVSKHKARMCLHPAGVVVHYKDKFALIPFGNCHCVTLDPADFA